MAARYSVSPHRKTRMLENCGFPPLNVMLLIVTIVLCLAINIQCASEPITCKDLPCYNGQCKENTTVECVCFDGWTGSSCSQCIGRIRLNETSGVIMDGMGNYSENNKCIWLLEPATATGPIYFSTQHFATECGWDHLYIFDGDSVFSPLIGAYSGLILSDFHANNSRTEVIATSGKAYIYFYSDAAYNMTGFHLTYSVGGCVHNCSGHGKCEGTTCSCDDQYVGLYCEFERCPNSCSGNGMCEADGTCSCYSSHRGDDCSVPVEQSIWQVVQTTGDTFSGRASPGSVIIGDGIWITGGYSLGKKTEFLVKYNVTTKTWKNITPNSVENPESIYGHSMVHYKDCLYVFGGVSDLHIQSRLWIYNMSENLWHHHDYNDTEAVAGHTAVEVGGVMYVIFGHSPVYGYMNRVSTIKLDIPDFEFKRINTTGARLKGGYGHTSMYDSQTGEVFVYGGYISGSSAQYTLTDRLLSFNVANKYWKILASSGSPRYLHSAVMMNGRMFVFGGNTHNDTSISYGAKCYSPDFLMYDPVCNKWRYITLATASKPPNAARYGHTAQSYTRNGKSFMYIIAGFTGLMLSDVLEYEPGICDNHMTKEVCLGKYEDRICAWTAKGQCVDRSAVINESEVEYHSSHKECNVSDGAAEYCASMHTCGSCLSSAYNCQWCSNNCTTSCSSQISKFGQCPNETDSSHCKTHTSCAACHLYQDCSWGGALTCSPRSKTTKKDGVSTKPLTQPTCDTPCYQYSSCENCTSKNCMWCRSPERCVETNSYVVSFLYGQCKEWTTQSKSCSSMKCSDLHTCQDCKSNPSCGWCNDVSNTGLGMCVEGSASGPISFNNVTGTAQVDNGICPAERWHFIDCPACQCNGHSSCTNVSNKCDKCMNLTEGNHCDQCIDGYHGNPKNGGSCTACSCNGQADTCNRLTGACYCRTRGVKGDACDSCDTSNNYHGNLSNGGTCYYDLKTDYQFTFNLSKPDDHYYKGINFMNIPQSNDRDVDFNVNCSGVAYLNITWKSNSHPQEQYKVREYMCTYFRAKFEHKEFNFGPEENVTFRVYVYGFKTPFLLQISFSQFPKIDLVHFFVTFFSCFLSLLIIAAVLYKIKHKYDSYRRRQRMIVEMEEMASRPFATSVIEFEKKFDSCQAEKKDTNPDLRKRKRSSNKPGQVTLEPLHNQKAAVLSLFVQLPTGDEEWTPPGHSGLMIGSALVTLGHQRKQSIEHGKMDKSKHRKHAFTSHDTCV